MPTRFVPHAEIPLALLELSGAKASVVQVRAEAKDYIDTDAMLIDRLPVVTAPSRTANHDLGQ
jgi:hypothetical protein